MVHVPQFLWCSMGHAMQANVRLVLYSWQRQKVGKEKKGKTWKTTHLCIMWNIWLERNRRCFEGKEENIPLLKNRCIQCLRCNADFAINIDAMLESWIPYSFRGFLFQKFFVLYSLIKFYLY